MIRIKQVKGMESIEVHVEDAVGHHATDWIPLKDFVAMAINAVWEARSPHRVNDGGSEGENA